MREGGEELANALAGLARELAELRGALAAEQRAHAAARDEAGRLRGQRQRTEELLAQEGAWLDQVLRPAPPSRLRRLLAGVRERQHPPAPAPTPPSRAAAPADPPLVPYARDGAAARPVLLAAVQGLVPAELARVVGDVQASAPAAGVHTVFLTDCNELALFRRRRALVEYLPPPDQLARFATPADAELYLARRMELLCRKWGPVRIVAYGDAATLWLAGITALPEAATVRGLLGELPR